MSGRLVLNRTVEPSREPLLLSEATEHLRVDGSDSDTYVDALIPAAREYVEEVTGRALITQTWTLKLDRFPANGEILLPRPPLQGVSSITYIDGDGSEQTLSASLYDVHTDDLPGRISRGYGDTWPITRDVPNAVTITYVAGYGDGPSDVPANLRHALKLLVGHMFAHREPEAAGTVVAPRFGFSVDALLAPYRVRWF